MLCAGAPSAPAPSKFNENFGILICTLCCCYASEEGMRRKLRFPCTKTSNKIRKYYLRQLGKGTPWAIDKQLHDSHNLRSLRGMVYCTRCCFRGTKGHVYNLDKPCAVGPNGQATYKARYLLKKASLEIRHRQPRQGHKEEESTYCQRRQEASWIASTRR